MSLKLKALGLSALAVVALSAVAVMNASAETDPNGHFTSDSKNGKTVITGIETGAPHDTELILAGLTPITCFNNRYDGTMSSNTVTSITVTPTYTDCRTKGSSTVNEVKVDHKGCNYTFKISKNSVGVLNTADLQCPAGQNLLITHPSCEMTVPAQNNIAGITYDTLTENNKHTITLTTAAKFTLHFHAGACVLLGTVKTGELKGAVTVEGYEHLGTVTNPIEGDRVNITATGSVS